MPGYAAPEATIAPSARVTGVLMTVRPRPPTSTSTRTADAPRSPTSARRPALDLSDEAILRAVAAWGGLLGAISLELFGHLHRA